VRVQYGPTRAHGKDVILMQASCDLALPEVPASELVENTSLGHHDITVSQFIATHIRRGQLHFRNVVQGKVPILHISDA
jgi:hypothetical protein